MLKYRLLNGFGLVLEYVNKYEIYVIEMLLNYVKELLMLECLLDQLLKLEGLIVGIIVDNVAEFHSRVCCG